MKRGLGPLCGVAFMVAMGVNAAQHVAIAFWSRGYALGIAGMPLGVARSNGGGLTLAK